MRVKVQMAGMEPLIFVDDIVVINMDGEGAQVLGSTSLEGMLYSVEALVASVVQKIDQEFDEQDGEKEQLKMMLVESITNGLEA